MWFHPSNLRHFDSFGKPHHTRTQEGNLEGMMVRKQEEMMVGNLAGMMEGMKEEMMVGTKAGMMAGMMAVGQLGLHY